MRAGDVGNPVVVEGVEDPCIDTQSSRESAWISSSWVAVSIPTILGFPHRLRFLCQSGGLAASLWQARAPRSPEARGSQCIVGGRITRNAQARGFTPAFWRMRASYPRILANAATNKWQRTCETVIWRMGSRVDGFLLDDHRAGLLQDKPATPFLLECPGCSDRLPCLCASKARVYGASGSSTVTRACLPSIKPMTVTLPVVAPSARSSLMTGPRNSNSASGWRLAHLPTGCQDHGPPIRRESHATNAVCRDRGPATTRRKTPGSAGPRPLPQPDHCIAEVGVDPGDRLVELGHFLRQGRLFGRAGSGRTGTAPASG